MCAYGSRCGINHLKLCWQVPDLEDSFGLVLRIDPEYFDALWEQSSNMNDENVSTIPLGRNIGKVGIDAITIGSLQATRTRRVYVIRLDCREIWQKPLVVGKG